MMKTMKETEVTGDFCAGANLSRSDLSTTVHRFFLPPKRNSEAQVKTQLFSLV